jgi:hypothetical protein
MRLAAPTLNLSAGMLALAARRHGRRFRRRRIRLWRRLLIESVSRYVEMARGRLAANERR